MHNDPGAQHIVLLGWVSPAYPPFRCNAASASHTFAGMVFP